MATDLVSTDEALIPPTQPELTALLRLPTWNGVGRANRGCHPGDILSALPAP